MYCNPHNNLFVNILKLVADKLKYYNIDLYRVVGDATGMICRALWEMVDDFINAVSLG